MLSGLLRVNSTLVIALFLGFGFASFAVAQVGIGTTTPHSSAQLELQTTTRGFLPPRMTAAEMNAIATPASGLVVYNTTANALYYRDGGTNTWLPIAGGGGDNLGNHTATTNIQLGANWLSGDGGSEGIAINAAGNVGIGVASPIAPLDINGGATLGTLRLFGSSDDFDVDGGTNGIYVLNNSSVVGGAGFRFKAGVTQIMALQNTGNVGIGTITPLNRLTVAQDLNTTDYDTQGQFGIRSTSNPDKVFMFGLNTTGNYGYVQVATDLVGQHPLLVNPHGGNVGIGPLNLTAPGAPLHAGSMFGTTNTVENILTLTRGSLATGANGNGARMSFESENTLGTIVTAAQLDAPLTTATAGTEDGQFTFRVRRAGTLENRMYISGGGQVGIESNPASNTPNFSLGRLTATAGTESASLSFRGEAVEHAGFSYIPHTTPGLGKLNIAFGGNANPGNNAASFTFQNNGNFGIGTAAPAAQLHTTGTVRFAGAPTTGTFTPITDDLLIVNALGDVQRFTGTFPGDNLGNHTATVQIQSTAGTAAAPGVAFAGDLDNGIFSPATDQVGIATAGTQRMVVDQIGRVGIGTNAPSVLLHLRNTIPPRTFLQHLNALPTAGMGIGLIDFADNQTTTAQARIQAVRDQNSSSGTDVPTSLVFSTVPDGSNALAPVMMLNNQGYLGVGPSPALGAPSATLHVDGTVRFENLTSSGTFTDASDDFVFVDASGNARRYTGSIPGDNLGNHTATTQIQSTAGTAAAPGIAFVGDLDNGLFSDAANEVAIATAGLERLRVGGTGSVGIGTGTSGSIRLNVVHTGTSANTYAISGDASGATTDETYGVRGTTASSNSIGAGVLGTTATAGAGVYALNTNTTGGTAALRAEHTGVTASSTYGIRASTISTGPGAAGILATAPLTGWAVDANGRLRVSDAVQFTGLGTTATLTGYELAAVNTTTGAVERYTGALPAWGLTGNTGTVLGTNYIGTSDNVGLEFRTNNTRSGRIMPSGYTTYGYEAGLNNTNTQLVAVGNGAARANTTGPGNTAVGDSALTSNTTGSQNTAFGVGTLQSSTTNSGNTAIGAKVLTVNALGDFNTGVGHFALNANTDGGYNTATGHAALLLNTTGDSNTAVGVTALRNNLTGSNNIAVGRAALLNNSSGVNNTALGFQAGGIITTGNNNTFIGRMANANDANRVNGTAIGANARVDADNAVVIGSITGVNAGTANANVGIGTTAPAYPLHLARDYATTNSGETLLTLRRTTSGTAATNIEGNILFELENNVGTAVPSGLVGSWLSTVTPGTEYGGVYFQTRRNGTMVNHVTFSGYGQVGINADPASDNPNLSMGSVTATAGTESASMTFRGNGVQHAGFSYVPHGTPGSGKLHIAFGGNANPGNNTPSFTFQNNGNLGVGTAAPAAQLHTTGTVRHAGLGTTATLTGYELAAVNTTTGQLERYTGAIGGAGWNLTGNAGTTPGTHFIGTTDAQPLQFKVNNIWMGILNDAGGITAFGSNAAEVATVPTTAFGWHALQTNTSGAANVAVGREAMRDNSTGGFNTALGSAALRFNTNGSNNVALGQSAMDGNLTGSDNVAVGRQALATTTGGNNNTALGAYAIYTNNSGNDNTAVGARALFVNTAGFNTSVGSSSLFSNTSGARNTAVGAHAMRQNVTGSFNVAMGDSTLRNNTNGSNTAVGASAMLSNVGGTDNTALGRQALYANTSGTGNTAMGRFAGVTITTGTNNTFMGNRADANATGRTNATAIGANARVDADNAVVIGSVNGINGAAATVNVGIGVNAPLARLHTDGTVRMANLATTATLTGYELAAVNTTTGAVERYTGTLPGDNLGNHTATVQIQSTAGTAAAPGLAFVGDLNTGIFNPAADQVAVATAGTQRMMVDGTGNVGIGVTPAHRLHIEGGRQFVDFANANNGSASVEIHNYAGSTGFFAPGNGTRGLMVLTTSDGAETFKVGTVSSVQGAGGNKYGVFAEGFGTGNNYGVFGQTNPSTTGIGLYGNVAAGAYTTAIGVYGNATAATSGFRASVRGDGSAAVWAGYFQGGPVFSGGNVGINVVPTASLHVGPANASALRINQFGTGAGQTGEIQLMEGGATSTEYVGFRAPDGVAANTIWTLPAADGTNGQVLTTNGAGTLSWATAAGTDNLGNHTATQNLNLATFQLVGNGGTSGIEIANSGAVGIGTTPSGAERLQIIGNINTATMVATNSNTTNNAAGVRGVSTANSGETYGVLGTTSNGTFMSAGVMGTSTAGSGYAIGVLGRLSGTVLGSSVFGDNTSNNAGTGVTGRIINGNSSSIGVHGINFGSGVALEGLTEAAVNTERVVGRLSNSNNTSPGPGLGSMLEFAVSNSVFGNMGIAQIGATATNTTSGAETGDISISTGVGGTFTKRMVVKSDGNVGIGTTSPGAQLHTTGSVRFAGIPTTATLTGYEVLARNTATGNVERYTGGFPGDNLGNHIATTNIQLGSNWLSGDGGNEGIRVDANGNVGIGTVTPVHSLDVAASASHAIRGITSDNTNSSAGVYGEATGSTAFVYGVYGSVSNSTNNGSAGVYGEYLGTVDGSGVYGYNGSNAALATGVYGYVDGTATNYGVWGLTASNANFATGVYGQATSTTASTYGVMGRTSGTAANATGVYGDADATTGRTYGVRGTNVSTTSFSAGVLGRHNASSASNTEVYGVHGIAATNHQYAAGVMGEYTGSGVGSGIIGYNTSATANSAGVYGQQDNTTGAVYGVKGIISSNNANAAGIYGQANGGGGLAVFGLASNTNANAARFETQSVSSANFIIDGRANSTSVFRVVSNGRVGIGAAATAPNYPLDVSGVINASAGFRVNNAVATPGTFLRGNGTNFVPANIQSSDLNAAAWRLDGNSGTTPGTHFIGTTDAVALDFRTNNTQQMRLDASGNLGIGINTPISRLTLSSVGSIGYNNASVVSFARTNDGGASVAGYSMQDQTGDFTAGHWSTGLLGAFEQTPLHTAGNQSDIGVMGLANNLGLNPWGGVFAASSTFLGNGQLDLSAATRYVGLASNQYAGVFMGGNVGFGTTAPESNVDVLIRMDDQPQVNFTGGAFPYGGEVPGLVISQGHSGDASAGYGYVSGLIDFRANDFGGFNNEASLAQIISTVDPNGGGSWSGGLMFATSPGGSTDPAGRRTTGAAPQFRMMLDHNGNLGIGTQNPTQLLHVADTRTANGSAAIFANAQGSTGDVYGLMARTASTATNASAIVANNTGGVASSRIFTGQNNGANRAILTNFGMLGLGNSLAASPAYHLHIAHATSGADGVAAPVILLDNQRNVATHTPGKLAFRTDAVCAHIEFGKDAGVGANPGLAFDSYINASSSSVGNGSGTNRMFISATNQAVGIGTINPGVDLEVADDNYAEGHFLGYNNTNFVSGALVLGHARGTRLAPATTVSGDVLGVLQFRGYVAGTGWIGAASQIRADATQNFTAATVGSALIFSTVANGTASPVANMHLAGNGFLGIGPNYVPTYALDIGVMSGPPSAAGRYFASAGNIAQGIAGAVNNISVRAIGGFWSQNGAGGGFICSSDERIKHILAVSDGRSDLERLMQIEVTDYAFRDTIGNQGAVVKGLIAQQLERVYPEAVTRQTNIIPNIYQAATALEANPEARTLTVTLPAAPDLAPGDRVRLITPTNENVMVMVSAVNGNTFTVQGWQETNATQVFVYGKEVNDFRVVDYDRVHTLGISAIQELARRNQALQEDHARLQQQVSAMAAQQEQQAQVNQTTEQRIQALEAMLARQAGR